VEEGNGEGAKHEKAANEDQLILLFEPIFHGVPDNQRRHHKQEHKVDENQNGYDPLSEGILIELIDELCKVDFYYCLPQLHLWNFSLLSPIFVVSSRQLSQIRLRHAGETAKVTCGTTNFV
jgi:hypothetical protein